MPEPVDVALLAELAPDGVHGGRDRARVAVRGRRHGCRAAAGRRRRGRRRGRAASARRGAGSRGPCRRRCVSASGRPACAAWAAGARPRHGAQPGRAHQPGVGPAARCPAPRCRRPARSSAARWRRPRPRRRSPVVDVESVVPARCGEQQQGLAEGVQLELVVDPVPGRVLAAGVAGEVERVLVRDPCPGHRVGRPEVGPVVEQRSATNRTASVQQRVRRRARPPPARRSTGRGSRRSGSRSCGPGPPARAATSSRRRPSRRCCWSCHAARRRTGGRPGRPGSRRSRARRSARRARSLSRPGPGSGGGVRPTVVSEISSTRSWWLPAGTSRVSVEPAVLVQHRRRVAPASAGAAVPERRGPRRPVPGDVLHRVPAPNPAAAWSTDADPGGAGVGLAPGAAAPRSRGHPGTRAPRGTR